MTSTLNAYRKVELNDELIQLWRYLMPMFLKVSPDTLLKNPKLEVSWKFFQFLGFQSFSVVVGESLLFLFDFFRSPASILG